MFLEQFGLSAENVLAYFSTSPFYSRQSINEQLRMQARFNSLQPTDTQRMKGTEYELWFHQPPAYFAIRSLERVFASLVLSDVYLVVHGTIYQCPCFRDVLNCRIDTFVALMHDVVDMLALARFDPLTGYKYTPAEQIQQSSQITGKQSKLGASQTENTMETDDSANSNHIWQDSSHAFKNELELSAYIDTSRGIDAIIHQAFLEN